MEIILIVGGMLLLLTMGIAGHFYWISRLKANNVLEMAETLSAAIDNSDILLWDYNLTTGVITAKSKNIEELQMQGISGKTPAQLVAEDQINPEDAETFLQTVQKIQDGDMSASCEVRMRSGAHYRWDRFTFTVICDETGKRVRAVITGINIGAQKRAERAYQKQLRLAEEMSDATLVAKGWQNLSKNRIEYYAKEQEAGLEFDSEEDTFDDMINKMAEGALSPEKAKEIRKTFSRSNLIQKFYEEVTLVTVEYQRKIGNGRAVWVSTQSKTIMDPEKKEIISFIYTYDISDKVMEQNIVKNITNVEYDFIAIIHTKTKEMQLINTNRDLTEHIPLTGRNYNENCRRIVEEYVVEREREKAMRSMEFSVIEKQLKESAPYVVTVSFSNGQGQVSRKKYLYTYLDESKEQIMLCRSDITDIYLQEQQQIGLMEGALKLAKQANEAKTDFLARMSHDIRTPMNGIIGITQLMLDTDISDEVRGELEKIDSSAHFLLGLVNDILDMTKVESGNLTLHPSPYPKYDFKKYINAVIKPLCDQKNIKFTLDLGDGKKVIVVDQLRFNQIFFNLLSNAVKFTDVGGNISLIVVNEAVNVDKAVIDVMVKDDGIGMSQSFQEHMYESFAQEINETEGHHKGSGLGLAIVKRLVDLMGGTIEVKSELNQGTEFIVHLEVPYVLEESLQVKYKSQSSVVNLVNKRILLCEDHPLNREIVQRVLNKEGMLVDSAENGQAGLMRFKIAPQNYYDAILMDIRMPVMDGLTATREIRKVERADAATIPIIALTANAFDEDIEKSKEAGINEHLAKPIEPQKLYEVLRYWMDERETSV